MLDDGRLTAMQIRTVPENDTGIGVINIVTQITRVLQGITRNLECEKMIRFLTIDGIRHDTEFSRIESVQVFQKSTGAGIDMLIGAAFRIVVTFRTP